MTKSFKISIILSACFIGLVRLKPIWERNLDGLWNILFSVFIPILFVWIISRIIIEVFKILKNPKLASLIPIGILLIGLLDVIYNPMKVNLERIYGDITFIACYEGTQNQATFTLREKSIFEIYSTGVFFSNVFFTGTYSQIGDTLFLKYNNSKKPLRFGDKILMDNKNKQLKAISSKTGSFKNPILFNYGYCKELN